MYAENLKKIRSELRYSREELANILGIPERTLSGYERNERTPSIDIATRLCVNLNVNINWFVTGQGEMFNAPKYDDVKDDLKLKVLDILKEQGLI